MTKRTFNFIQNKETGEFAIFDMNYKITRWVSEARLAHGFYARKSAQATLQMIPNNSNYQIATIKM